ncbi:MAG: ABC transporter permease [Candidatus Methanoperedens sp.]|nr:ABC transporter permease [Candidatus Methanoperedens sp.]
MNKNIRNVVTIAGKEFADSIGSPVFLALTVTFTLITFVFSYQQGLAAEYMSQMGRESTSVLMSGLRGISGIITWFAPLIGIALSFDAVIREQKSGSMNVLLTHPVFRDTVILGKLLGSMLILFIVLFVSTVISVGTLLFLFGGVVSTMELTRIALYVMFTFLYVLVFLGIGIILSIVVKDATDSLIYNITIWLGISIVFTVIVIAFFFLSGQTLAGNPEGWGIIAKISNISPMHHFAELVTGRTNLGWGGPGIESNIRGILDTRFTLTQWFSEFWMNLTVLIVAPIILLITAFIAFLRKDIST